MYSVQVINKKSGEIIDQVHCPQQLLADHVAEMIDRHVDHAIFMVRVRAPGVLCRVKFGEAELHLADMMPGAVTLVNPNHRSMDA